MVEMLYVGLGMGAFAATYFYALYKVTKYIDNEQSKAIVSLMSGLERIVKNIEAKVN
jgi:type III secretory pathway component EscT